MKPKRLKKEDFFFQPARLKESDLILGSLEKLEYFSEDLTVVEIGTFWGLTALTVVQVLNELSCQSKFYSVDENQSYWSHITRRVEDWTPKQKWNENLSKYLPGIKCIPSFVEQKSEDAVGLFNKIHWCLIDGCHCYECASKDIELYGSKIVPGGFLLIDDTKQWDNKQSQWYHDKKLPRRQAVIKAIKDSEVLQGFTLVGESHVGHGLQLWRRNSA